MPRNTTAPPTPASAASPGSQQASTGKSKYSRKFNAKWVATPPSSGRGSPAAKNPSAAAFVEPEAPSLSKRSSTGSVESRSSSQDYIPSPPPPPVFQQNPTGPTTTSNSPAKSPPYGGEASHKVPMGINPSPVPPNSTSFYRTNSHASVPSEPNIRENPVEDWISVSASNDGGKTSPSILKTLTGFVREKRNSKKLT